MDGGSTPNRGTDPEILEDLPQLGSSISRKSSFNKGLLIMFVVGVIAALIAVNVITVNGSQQDKTNHHYTIADHLGAPPEQPKASKQNDVNRVDLTHSKVLHTGLITTQPQYAVIGSQNKAQQTPQQRKQLDGLLAFDQSASAQKNSSQNHEPQSTQAVNSNQNALQQQLQASKLKGSLASRIVNPNLFITKGAFLDCILETAISSDVPGMTRCQLSRDIYSTNGKVLLLEKGSHIVGQYQGGLQQGIARIFVLWDRIETPNSVIIDLDSAGTDTLGRSGHSGFVDGHFKQRFGSAMLLSLIGDIGQYAANKANSGNKNQIQFGNTIGGSKDLAAIALQDSIGIKPTLLKNQGEHINVFVARDLDFRSVYDLRLTD
ncbi:TrbI/VirB10 family protein [Parashewanella spongiae]|uniref:TrbI/VirB10 family protein n=1 Tax=Parashewanella spongiae TaxID=342950 RepID=A0A3A6UJJ2_9GAMM|nr:type IV secretion system protein VirB10 [Parashewanella spongiae]MCL1077095.1 type IV secretion system protein VirB10 [Parashewanella spongiae]RJY17670.1 TrbI/VirB10 family protein [Parashewanella spongiae]